MRGPKKRLTPFGKMVVKALADRDMSRAELAATVPWVRFGPLLVLQLCYVLQLERRFPPRP